MRFAMMLGLALGAVPAVPASDALKARDAEIRAALPPAGKDATPEQKAKAQTMLVKIVVFHQIAQATLGKAWDATPEPKRKAFEEAFVRRFKLASAEQLDYFRTTQIQYAAEEKAGERTKVPTTIDIGGEPTHVTYVMAPGKDGWLIEDIVIDDVSTVSNYRSSFAKVVGKEGIDGLITRLNKADPAAAGGPTAPDSGAPKKP